MTKSFTHYVGIDWSGAKGHRHAGLAVALCDSAGNVSLVLPPGGNRRWSREGCMKWISGGCGQEGEARTLVGVDSAFSMPFMDYGRYFPAQKIAVGAKALWQSVEADCAGAVDLFGGLFVDKYSDYYLRPNNRGVQYERRMRVTENVAVSSGAGPCESVYHLIGPSQVGLSGLSTMRMLARMDMEPQIAIWPYDDVSKAPIVLTEIYAAAFAALGGHKGKVRDQATLANILEELDASLPSGIAKLSDHDCDAIVTAAALRYIAPMRKYWNPELLSTMVRRTEGWVFGIV